MMQMKVRDRIKVNCEIKVNYWNKVDCWNKVNDPTLPKDGVGWGTRFASSGGDFV